MARRSTPRSERKSSIRPARATRWGPVSSSAGSSWASRRRRDAWRSSGRCPHDRAPPNRAGSGTSSPRRRSGGGARDYADRTRFPTRGGGGGGARLGGGGQGRRGRGRNGRGDRRRSRGGGQGRRGRG